MTSDRLSEIEARLARDPAYDMPRLYERIDRVELWTLAKAVERNDIALLLRLVRLYESELKRLQTAPFASDGVIATKALNEGERIKEEG